MSKEEGKRPRKIEYLCVSKPEKEKSINARSLNPLHTRGGSSGTEKSDMHAMQKRLPDMGATIGTKD